MGKLSILFIIISLLTNFGFALPQDREQILQFRAGSADINQQTHHGIYIGDVQLDQGSTHIRAAEAITDGNLNEQINKATIKGNSSAQAHFWTHTSLDKPPLHAYADIIYYYPKRHFVELVGMAHVEQGNNSFKAPKICYDTLTHHVTSKSDGKALTTIIIHPEKHK